MILDHRLFFYIVRKSGNKLYITKRSIIEYYKLTIGEYHQLLKECVSDRRKTLKLRGE